MDMAALRQALADAAATVPGLAAWPYAADSVSEPCLVVESYEVDFDQATARSADDVTLTCKVLASRADDLSGQAALDAYLAGSGSASIKAAIESDPTLTGECDYVHVRRAQGYGIYTIAGTAYYGAELVIDVGGVG